MSILVTGGAGFIGSHTAVELLNAGRDIVIIDNFSNSKPEVLDKIREITGKDFKFYEVDYLNRKELEKVFEENKIEAVLNFAGYKAVGESVKKPLEYYENKQLQQKKRLISLLFITACPPCKGRAPPCALLL